MRKIFKNVLFVLSSLIIISCSTGRIENLERMPNEAIIIARVNVWNKGELVSKNSSLVFDENFILKDDEVYGEIDDSSYIYIKVPCGLNYIMKVSNIGEKFIPPYALRVNLPESKIYYIGDIELKLDIPDYNPIYSTPVVSYFEELFADKSEIKVTDNYDSTVAYFNKMFSSNEKIYKNIIIFDTLRNEEIYDSVRKHQFYKLNNDTTSKSYKRRKMK